MKLLDFSAFVLYNLNDIFHIGKGGVMEYEDDIVAFRYMTISTMKRKDTDDE